MASAEAKALRVAVDDVLPLNTGSSICRPVWKTHDAVVAMCSGPGPPGALVSVWKPRCDEALVGHTVLLGSSVADSRRCESTPRPARAFARGPRH